MSQKLASKSYNSPNNILLTLSHTHGERIIKTKGNNFKQTKTRLPFPPRRYFSQLTKQPKYIWGVKWKVSEIHVVKRDKRLSVRNTLLLFVKENYTSLNKEKGNTAGAIEHEIKDVSFSKIGKQVCLYVSHPFKGVVTLIRPLSQQIIWLIIWIIFRVKVRGWGEIFAPSHLPSSFPPPRPKFSFLPHYYLTLRVTESWLTKIYLYISRGAWFGECSLWMNIPSSCGKLCDERKVGW